MCGRFTQRFSWQQVHDYMNLLGPPVELRPRYNVAPGQDLAAIRAHPDGRRLSMLRWGLLPSWAKDPNIGYRMINARAETVAGKPAYRAAYQARRCLIPADGFYEWVRRGAVKQPFLIELGDGRLMGFAGLWERWRIPDNIVLPRTKTRAASSPQTAIKARRLAARVRKRGRPRTWQGQDALACMEQAGNEGFQPSTRAGCPRSQRG